MDLTKAHPTLLRHRAWDSWTNLFLGFELMLWNLINFEVKVNVTKYTRQKSLYKSSQLLDVSMAWWCAGTTFKRQESSQR